MTRQERRVLYAIRGKLGCSATPGAYPPDVMQSLHSAGLVRFEENGRYTLTLDGLSAARNSPAARQDRERR